MSESPRTLYADRAALEATAARCNADEANDDGWTYTVVAVGKYFVIEVRDETNFFLGYL
jgi:hypothetical protein